MRDLLASLAHAIHMSPLRNSAHTCATLKPEFIEPFLLKVVAELPIIIKDELLFELVERATTQQNSHSSTKVGYQNALTPIDCRTRKEGDLVQLHFYSPSTQLIKMLTAEMDEFCAVQAGVNIKQPLYSQLQLH